MHDRQQQFFGRHLYSPGFVDKDIIAKRHGCWSDRKLVAADGYAGRQHGCFRDTRGVDKCTKRWPELAFDVVAELLHRGR